MPIALAPVNTAADFMRTLISRDKRQWYMVSLGLSCDFVHIRLQATPRFRLHLPNLAFSVACMRHMHATGNAAASDAA